MKTYNVPLTQATEDEMTLDLQRHLSTNGWVSYHPGHNHNTDYSFRYYLFIRRRPISTVSEIGNFNQTLPGATSQKPHNSADPMRVSISTTGNPHGVLTPWHTGSEPSTGFDSCKSLEALRNDEQSLAISYDTEYYDIGHHERCVLSWQFAVVWDDYMHEFLFVRKLIRDDNGLHQFRLSMEHALGRILDIMNLTYHNILPAIRDDTTRKFYALTSPKTEGHKPIECSFNTLSEAEKAASYWYDGRTPTNIPIDSSEVHFKSKGHKTIVKHNVNKDQRINITLLCHAAKPDLKAFDQSESNSVNIMLHMTEVQGGLVSMQPISKRIPRLDGNNYHYHYYVSISFRDTMSHAPAKKKSLDSLGKACGVPKVYLPDSAKGCMNVLLISDPKRYAEYASRDAVTTLMFSSMIYGYNHVIPVSMTSASAKIIRRYMMDYFGVDSDKDFDHVYRGLHSVKHGLVASKNKSCFIEATSKEPINNDAAIVQLYTSYAYHGGYNGCSEVGLFCEITYDIDLKNAYPTAMCLIPDINWECPIQKEIKNRYLTIDDFGEQSVVDLLMVAYCEFEFPDSVKFPCCPVPVEGSLIYPRTSKGINGAYVLGPELLLALKLGCKVYVKHGLWLNPLLKVDGSISYSLRDSLKELINDRTKANEMFGINSLQSLILKYIVNAIYGKHAQNVIDKSHWNCKTNRMESIGPSVITNPVPAALTTALIRATLLAVQNQVCIKSYSVPSVTTDGFISNMELESINRLDLYGFKNLLESSRLYITDGSDASLWEIKHCQDDLINYTTRGNVSLHDNNDPDSNYKAKNIFMHDGKLYAGVCAHNSCPSLYPSDTYEDRLWLMENVVSRSGKVRTESNIWPELKTLISDDTDFYVESVTSNKSMDFDLKRKPDPESFKSDKVLICGAEHIIAHFKTLPFEDIEEYLLYRKVKKSFDCLKTEEQWYSFLKRVSCSDAIKGKHIKDLEWSKLCSAIMGYRFAMWDIPYLNDTTLSLDEKIDWINQHNNSKRVYNKNTWKNAHRRDRLSQMLPKDMLQDTLTLLGAITI